MRENMGVHRGKAKINGEWVVGCYECCYTQENRLAHGIITLNHAQMSVDWYEVFPETVGEYTGLRDCKRTEEYPEGQMIFEGDIIKTHYANAIKSDFIECVVFRNGKFCGECTFDTGGKMYAPLADGVDHIPQDKSVYMEWCEVIGNIHDNPELLEVSEDD